jgi:hypothetical protein
MHFSIKFINSEYKIYPKIKKLDSSLTFLDIISKFTNCKSLYWLTFGPLHVLTHELGHALAHSLQIRKLYINIEISNNAIYGLTHQFTSDNSTITSVTGPLADILFSSGIICSAIYFYRHILPPNIFSTILCSAMACNGIYYILGEAIYSITDKQSDFAKISKNSTFDLVLSSIVCAAAALIPPTVTYLAL